LSPLRLIVVSATAEGLDWSRIDPDGFCNDGLFQIWNRKKQSMASLGNQSVIAVDRMHRTVIGLCHADVSFGPGALQLFTSAAMDGNVVGIVGVDLQRTYRWSKDNPGPVSTLDSCSVFFRRDLGLRFDEQTFDGFHCHVEDLCLQAQARGIPILVPPAQAWHVGQSTNNPAWQADYAKYRARLAMKWRGVRFETT
jgi:hypothetical protein